MTNILTFETYEEHERHLPSVGKFIIAQFDKDSIIVYQGFKDSIATHALKNKRFGGNDYDFTRSTCLKPSFLWMMYYSGWAKNTDQENILAIRIKRTGFEQLIGLTAVKNKNAVLEWEAYHDLQGNKTDRKAAKFTISGDMMKRYNEEWILDIADITPFVKEQQALILAGKLKDVQVPSERAYAPADLEVLRKIDATTISL
jgi:hypothetical protein